MDFFNVGALELIVIFVVAFIVLGPERVSDFAQSLGKLARQFREGTQQITRDLTLKEPEKANAKPADQETLKPPAEQDPKDPTVARPKGK